MYGKGWRNARQSHHAKFKGRTGALRATVANMPNQFLGWL
jgi:hypothetical protein